MSYSGLVSNLQPVNLTALGINWFGSKVAFGLSEETTHVQLLSAPLTTQDPVLMYISMPAYAQPQYMSAVNSGAELAFGAVPQPIITIPSIIIIVYLIIKLLHNEYRNASYIKEGCVVNGTQ